ncbi:MAG TPA: transcriptional regulator [Pseudomonas xinjiangensis]|uniref:Transcriptional regulator n=2 Tax=root TaxID=1 RepID=A0A7V1BRZ0_9GAMM|nr:transcriptional regulator [Halopseudomonas xinjiangensis]HEC46973.1 transcriptional regulator [Halopseudomonas xinjiangensis]
MAFERDDTSGSPRDPRRDRRREEDKKRMAYRRAIEDYRESQALHHLVADFPEMDDRALIQG